MSTRQSRNVMMAIVIMTILGLAGVAEAYDNTYWKIETGDWSVASNWTNGVPHDHANIDNGGTAQITQGYEIISHLKVGSVYGQSGNVEMSFGRLKASNGAYIGDEGVGTFAQTGGTNYCDLDIGRGTFASGTYELSGTGELSGNSVIVGGAGTGRFIQTGGTNGGLGNVYLGYNRSGRGVYELSNTGELSRSSVIVGRDGSGMFVQTGGTNTISDMLSVGIEWGGTGTYTISDGELSIGSLCVENGAFRVIGDDAAINVDSYSQEANGELYSIFDSGGLSVVEVSGTAELEGDWYVEGSGFGRFDVLRADDVSGSFSNVYLPEEGWDPDWDWGWSWGIDDDTLWVEYVPEPCSVALLALGGLAMIRRRC